MVIFTYERANWREEVWVNGIGGRTYVMTVELNKYTVSSAEQNRSNFSQGCIAQALNLRGYLVRHYIVLCRSEFSTRGKQFYAHNFTRILK
jgi:hypothetical protein